MATLQRNMHTMAVQLAESDARVSHLDNRCGELERTGTTTAENLSEACGNIVDRYLPRAEIDLRFATVSENTNILDARLCALTIEVESIQQGPEQTQPQQTQPPQQSSSQPPVMPMSQNARVKIQEVAANIPVPNGDAEINWNSTVEANGSPFAQGAETSQRQPDPRYMAPELLPPQTQNQAQPIPEIDPRPRHYCRDPYVAP